MSAEGQLDLPKGVVKRIVKEKLAGAAEDGKDVLLNKEALLAFAESAKIFINYVTAAANDLCKEKKRATLNADDVLLALEELEFDELLPELRQAFEAYKQSTKEKKERKAEVSRKRKSTSQAGEADTAAQADTGPAAAAAAAAQPGDDEAAADKADADDAGEEEGEEEAAGADQDMEEAAADDDAGSDDAAAEDAGGD